MVIGFIIGIGARSLHLHPPFALRQVLNQLFSRIYAPVVMPALMVAAYDQLHGSTGRELAPMQWKASPPRHFDAASLR